MFEWCKIFREGGEREREEGEREREREKEREREREIGENAA